MASSGAKRCSPWFMTDDDEYVWVGVDDLYTAIINLMLRLYALC